MCIGEVQRYSCDTSYDDWLPRSSVQIAVFIVASSPSFLLLLAKSFEKNLYILKVSPAIDYARTIKLLLVAVLAE
jgi:hypothetical protein